MDIVDEIKAPAGVVLPPKEIKGTATSTLSRAADADAR